MMDEAEITRILRDLNYYVRSPLALIGIELVEATGQPPPEIYQRTRQAGSTLSCLIQELREFYRANATGGDGGR